MNVFVRRIILRPLQKGSIKYPVIVTTNKYLSALIFCTTNRNFNSGGLISENSILCNVSSKSYFPPILLSIRFASNRMKDGDPVDWLPFSWEKPDKFNIFEQSGDKIRITDMDLSLPRKDFELSDELNKSNEFVKKVFSLETATRRELMEVERDMIIKRVQRHPMDFNSLEVKIAGSTVRVRYLFRCQVETNKPKLYKVRLMWAIHQRNRLLKILYQIDRQRFDWLIKELHLEYTPAPTSVKLERFTKKWDLRRLTREYCEKIRSDKLAAFQEELRSQQEAFLREKEETLAWIAKEEKELGVSEETQKN